MAKEKIQDILEELKINDKKIQIGNSEPQKPTKAIEKLVSLGHDAVPHLLTELQNYREEGIPQYYAEYVVEILGEIGDPRALEELVNITRTDFDVEIHENASIALSKLGDIAISYYLDKTNQTTSSEIIFDALWVFLHLKEKNTDVLEFAKHVLNESKEYDLQVSAIEVIGQHGTQKEIDLIEPLLDEHEDLGGAAKDALQKILKDNQAKLREVLVKHKIIGEARCDDLGRKLNLKFRSLGYRYRPAEKLEGQAADELNEAVREYFSTKSISESLYEIAKFATDEGILSDVNKEKILDVWRSLLRKENELTEKYVDTIALYDYGIRENLKTQLDELRSYKDLYPVPTDTKTKIKNWLSSQHLETSEITFKFFYEDYAIIAKGTENRSCIIWFTKTPGKRKYGDVRLRILGYEWNQNETIHFKNGFWSLFNNLKNLS